MSDPRIFYDPKTKKIVRTDPPGLMKLIQPVEGTNFITVPQALFDLDRARFVSVQHGIETRKA